MVSTTTNSQRLSSGPVGPSLDCASACGASGAVCVSELRICENATPNESYSRAFSGAFSSHSLILAIAAIVAVLAVACITPLTAYAKSYTCPSVEINAVAGQDATLSVTETRTFDFDGTFSAVWWSFDSMPSNECELTVSSISLAPEGGQAVSLPEVEFQRTWRESGGPAEPAFSVDVDRKTVYVFAPMADARIDVTLTYSISNFVQIYDDVAELYWQYVGHGWSVDSDHVVASVHVRCPQGPTPVPTTPCALGATVRSMARFLSMAPASSP